MRLWASITTWALCTALNVLALAPRTASAAPKNKLHSAAPRKPTQKNLKKAAPAAAVVDRAAKADDAPSANEIAADKPDNGEASSVKTAGTNVPKAAPGAAAADATVQEDKAGVKTYKFGTVEVEGRMKSPQIIYFMRRVRAEFDAGALGHRSFMRELRDTRNNSALR